MPHRLIYVSSAVTPYDQADQDDILAVARQRNSAEGITGMLLYHDGNILQVLEGPEDRVTACFDRIAQDPRHQGCIVLQSEAVAGRTFAQWDMAYVPFVELSTQDKEGFLDLLALRQSEKMRAVEDDPKAQIFIDRFLASFSDLATT
jgi:hypothetical protein